MGLLKQMWDDVKAELYSQAGAGGEELSRALLHGSDGYIQYGGSDVEPAGANDPALNLKDALSFIRDESSGSPGIEPPVQLEVAPAQEMAVEPMQPEIQAPEMEMELG